MKKVVTVVGARPQFIKCAPVSLQLRRFVIEILVHTGQHYDAELSEVFFQELSISEPDYNLGVGSGSHGEQTGEMLKKLEGVLTKERPECVLVYGDTNSTLAGAMAAAKLQIPVAHVEAGLRSYNRRMAEEINRVVTDHLSSLLFAPTETAVKNLHQEGISRGVHLVGDVMYDALLDNVKLAEHKSRVLDRLGIKPRGYVLATVHRAENADNADQLRNILEALRQISAFAPVVWPVHPRTRKNLRRFFSARMNCHALRLINPVSYLDMLMLEKNARLILTDSGGIQKEAHWFEVPCVTLREETEWVETVEAGWNKLAGTDPERILKAATEAMLAARRVQGSFNRKGGAAGLIVDLLFAFIGLS